MFLLAFSGHPQSFIPRWSRCSDTPKHKKNLRSATKRLYQLQHWPIKLGTERGNNFFECFHYCWIQLVNFYLGSGKNEYVFSKRLVADFGYLVRTGPRSRSWLNPNSFTEYRGSHFLFWDHEDQSGTFHVSTESHENMASILFYGIQSMKMEIEKSRYYQKN